MSTPPPDLYDRLGVSPSASPREIAEAYQTLKAATRTQNEEDHLTTAFLILARPTDRERYDRMYGYGAAAATATQASAPQQPLPREPVEAVLADLDELVGLLSVKQEVLNLVSLMTVQQRRQERGLPTQAFTNHLVLTGGPGTGKTSVARLIARCYHSLGVTRLGHFVEASRSDLVGEYVGQTALKTDRIIAEARGGVLFIDEAYALSRAAGSDRSDFGIEALDQLVLAMENLRDDLIVIVAGYPYEMERFLAANPGLRSRFRSPIAFPDYSLSELLEILDRMAETAGYRLSPEAQAQAAKVLSAALVAAEHGTPFGNARTVRNLLDETIRRQSHRLFSQADASEETLMTLLPADLPPSV